MGPSYCWPHRWRALLDTLPVAGDVLTPAVLLGGGMVVRLVAAKVVLTLTVVLMVGGISGGLVAGMFSLVTLLGIEVVRSVASVLSPGV